MFSVVLYSDDFARRAPLGLIYAIKHPHHSYTHLWYHKCGWSSKLVKGYEKLPLETALYVFFSSFQFESIPKLDFDQNLLSHLASFE